MFRTIKENVSSELIEKKSKFIANIIYVENEDDVSCELERIEKKYFDAKHICFAYRIVSTDGIIEKFTDNGEPSGTAGGPILKLLSSQNLLNVLVVVTRYFGGILLGTGGLVRAYSGVAQEALSKAQIVNKEYGNLISFQIDYSDVEKCKYFLQKNNINIINNEYNENVKVIIEISDEKLEILKDKYKMDFSIKHIELIEKKYINKREL